MAYIPLRISQWATLHACSTHWAFTIAEMRRRCSEDQVYISILRPRSYATLHPADRGGCLDTWTETEERRRIWWAVLMFDRYAHAGFRFRPLSTTSIPADELLPASDEDWETGVSQNETSQRQNAFITWILTPHSQNLSINPLLVMSMEAITFVSPFARSCQVAHLLGRVCEHVNQHPSSTDADFHFQEALQLSLTIRALLKIIEEESDRAGPERSRYFASRGLAYGALSILYDVHSCVEPDDVEAVGGHRGLRLDIQRHAIDGFKQVSKELSTLAADIEQCCASGMLDKLPLVVLFPLHAAAGTYAWHARETGAESSLSELTHIRKIIKILSAKWRIAGESHDLFLCIYLGFLCCLPPRYLSKDCTDSCCNRPIPQYSRRAGIRLRWGRLPMIPVAQIGRNLAGCFTVTGLRTNPHPSPFWLASQVPFGSCQRAAF